MIDQIKSRSLGLWTKFGQRLDNPVWTKIGLFLDSKDFPLMRNILWTKSGLTLDLHLFWTIFGLGQSLAGQRRVVPRLRELTHSSQRES